MLILLTLENIIVCIGGLLIGILSGSILHKALILFIIHLLGLSIDLNAIPFIKWNAITSSLLFVLVVLLALTVSNLKLLLKSTLLELVRLEKKREKPIRIRKLSAVIGILFLGSGYFFALDMMRGSSSLWVTIGFSPIALLTLLLVVLGTALFIYSFLPFFCNQIERRKKMLYKENTIIVIPKFMHRIRSNAKSLILLILLSAGTLAILGSTVLTTWYPIAALERIIPSAMEFRITDSSEKSAVLHTLDKTLAKDTYQTYETEFYKLTASSKKLPEEYNISKSKGISYGSACTRYSADIPA